jgi:hypothetical protein
MAPKPYSYPYPEDDIELKQLMDIKQKLDNKREEIVKRIRQLIYKIEKPR